jgi:hypothetical protein
VNGIPLTRAAIAGSLADEDVPRLLALLEIGAESVATGGRFRVLVVRPADPRRREPSHERTHV